MDYNSRLAQAQAMYLIPPKCDQPGQKFPRGCRVKVTDKMPPSMSHFRKGFVGIVEYTYAQKYGGSNVDSYSLLVLDDDSSPSGTTAWYKESQLTLLSGDTAEGMRLIEKYVDERQVK